MKNIFKKSLVIMIILLFIGSTTVPLINAQLIKIGDQESIHEKNTDVLLYKNFQYIEFVPGEIIVKFKERAEIFPKIINNRVNFGLKSIDDLNDKHNVKIAEKLSKEKSNSFLSNVYKFILPEDATILSVVAEYSLNPYVEYAEPNYLYYTCNTPNDPYFDYQWALHNTGQTGGTPDADIDAPEAWGIELGRSDVTIAILDSGVDYMHPDIVGNIWINDNEIPDNGNDDDDNGYIDDVCGWDFANDDNDPVDDFGHGTHCAGIVGAVANNSIGVAGVCWKCKIMPVKIGSFFISSNAAANGIIYAADNGANVISMSWGGAGESQAIKDALDYAYSKGVVLIAAAGNNNIDLDNFPLSFYPAEYDNVISVAATDPTDKIADFSNYGIEVDVAAPGVNILSTMPTYNVTLNEKGLRRNYDNMSGTSMACPHVAGLAGLILSGNPNLDPLMVRTILHSSTEEIVSEKCIGFGRINAFTALQKTAVAIANINSPLPNTEVEGVVEIKGTATGEQFQEYMVEYGRGISPDTWIQICSSDTSIEDDILVLWDTTTADECFYTIRLILITNDMSYEDRSWVMVNNLHNTIFVNDDNVQGPWDGTDEHPYQYIQDAVYEAGTGDTVHVFNGSYREDVSVNKGIELLGEDRDITILNADRSTCITIFADGVKISGFSLISRYASLLIYSNNNTIIGNVIEPLLPHISYGIIIQPLTFVIGRLSSGEIVAITPHLQGNNITNNEIIKNNIGIFLYETSENSIGHNNFIDNLVHAVFIYNSVSITDFVFRNRYQYKSPSVYNHWYENYWDDWIGIKHKRCQRLPKCIQGEVYKSKLFFISTDTLFRRNHAMRWFNFDRNPLSEPYDGGG